MLMSYYSAYQDTQIHHFYGNCTQKPMEICVTMNIQVSKCMYQLLISSARRFRFGLVGDFLAGQVFRHTYWSIRFDLVQSDSQITLHT